jgi:hypothetical protein
MSLPKKSLSEAFLNTHPKLLRYNDSEYSGETYKED